MDESECIDAHTSCDESFLNDPKLCYDPQQDEDFMPVRDCCFCNPSTRIYDAMDYIESTDMLYLKFESVLSTAVIVPVD